MTDDKIEKAIDKLVEDGKPVKEGLDDSNNFMQPEVVEGDWYEIDGAEGTVFLPIDILGTIPAVEDYLNRDDDEITDDVARALSEFVMGEVWTIEKRHGFGARLSAPGYLDATDWSVYDTEEEARADLEQMYGDE